MLPNLPGDFKYDPDTNYNDYTIRQQAQIEKQISESQVLISGEDSIITLRDEYCLDGSDPAFIAKIDEFKDLYKVFRRVRADGNCFYRGFAFAYFESLLNDPEELDRFKTVIARRKDEMVDIGMPQFTLEDFYETFLEVVNRLNDPNFSKQNLLDIFNDQGYSDYLVVFLRLLVSGYLQQNESFYSAFVEGGRTVKEFCAQEVEPMARESDHIHITALTATTGISIRVEYLDRTQTKQPVHHDFPENTEPRIFLLYRPGHYDIFYRKSPGVSSTAKCNDKT